MKLKKFQSVVGLNLSYLSRPSDPSTEGSVGSSVVDAEKKEANTGFRMGKRRVSIRQKTGLIDQTVLQACAMQTPFIQILTIDMGERETEQDNLLNIYSKETDFQLEISELSLIHIYHNQEVRNDCGF